MSNFPEGQEFADGVIVRALPEDLIANLKRLKTYQHPFIKRLIECGVLPAGCQDFQIDCPLDGVVAITATYLVDKEAFEKATGTESQ